MRSKPTTYDALDIEIFRIVDELSYLDPMTEEYDKTLARLRELFAISNKKTRRFTGDAMLSVVAQLVSVLIVVGYERTHVITTKAFGLGRTTRP